MLQKCTKRYSSVYKKTFTLNQIIVSVTLLSTPLMLSTIFFRITELTHNISPSTRDIFSFYKAKLSILSIMDMSWLLRVSKYWLLKNLRNMEVIQHTSIICLLLHRIVLREILSMLFYEKHLIDGVTRKVSYTNCSLIFRLASVKEYHRLWFLATLIRLLMMGKLGQVTSIVIFFVYRPKMV